jgi:hypothetical protein
MSCPKVLTSNMTEHLRDRLVIVEEEPKSKKKGKETKSKKK